MAFVTAALIVGGGALGAAALGAYSSNKAANTQADAANAATQLQRDQYNQTRADQAPFLQGGYSAENRMLDLLGLSNNQGAAGYGSLNKPFTYNDMTADPGYAFRLSEGLKGMNATAAARGGLISGSALKAGQQYGQAMGSQEYQNAFNRYQVQRSNILNPLQSLTGAGQSSANVLAGTGANYANNAGQNIIGAGNARASGYVGGANAITGGIGQYVNYMNQQNLLNRLLPQAAAYNDPFAGGNTSGPAYQ